MQKNYFQFSNFSILLPIMCKMHEKRKTTNGQNGEIVTYPEVIAIAVYVIIHSFILFCLFLFYFQILYIKKIVHYDGIGPNSKNTFLSLF